MPLKRLAVVVFLSLGAAAFAAQRQQTPAAPEKKAPPPPEESKTDEESAGPQRGFKFRNLGPAAGGGRITAIAGIPGDPNVIYVGSASGGVWKTVDGGVTFKPIFEKYPPSIGAIAIAPSNPNLVWVGTGEANPRNNVIDGHGVYFSPDGGASWRSMGLTDAGQISRILIDPGDPDTVFVAALGSVWKPNTDRGVFRTTDGGATWKKVLFVDAETGASDLVMQPGNSRVLFAGMWQFRRFPWDFVGGGPGSGMWKSTDGGSTWKKLEKKDLPEGPLGRISLAIAPSNGNHVYALIHSRKGILFESKDLGEKWEKLSDTRLVSVRPWYFHVIAVSPVDENKLYFGSFNLVTSIDGGKTFQTNNRRIHPDYHALWIDPKDPDRILQGNDGFALQSTDGGKTWRPFDLPLGQFYQVAVGTDSPYTVCGGLQDNNGWCGTSNSLARGGMGDADWFVVTGGDGEWVVPAPSDPNVIYADSQNGNISRFDRRTKISRNIRPYLAGAGEMPPADLKYRFNWTSPITVAAKDANEVYVGGNVVFKSADGGLHWTVASPDLTRNDKAKQTASGGPVHLDLSGAETYNTLLSLAISPVDPKVIWAGSDDGLVHVTKDGGQTWTNVSPKGAPEWARVYQIDPSPFDAGGAHLVYDAHMLGNRRPYLYGTADFGKTWTSLSKGLPDDGTAYVVRENPNRKGFFVVGTDDGLHYSTDAGRTWKKVPAEFPRVPVWDLKFAASTHDLIVASHGRGMWVFDDITVFEEKNEDVEGKDLHLFAIPPASLWQTWNRGDVGVGDWTAPNPPPGAIVDYWLKKEILQTEEQKKQKRDPVKITVHDEKGNLVATEYGPAKQGINRHVWQLRYSGPKKITFGREPPPSEFFDPNRGPEVVPGVYRVTVEAAGKTESREVTVGPDPRWPVEPDSLRARAKAALEGRNTASAVNEMLNRLDGWETQLTALPKLIGAGEDGDPAASKRYETALASARELVKKVKELKDQVYNRDVQRDTPSDTLHFHSDVQGRAARLAQLAGPYGEGPREVVREEIVTVQRQVEAYLTKFNALLSRDVPSYNRVAAEQGVPTLFVGEPIRVEGPAM